MAGWIAFLLFGGGGLALLWVGVTQYRPATQRRLSSAPTRRVEAFAITCSAMIPF